MADPTGFIKHKRGKLGYRPVEERIHDFKELDIPLSPDDLILQASRCMDCGIPFCHGCGCPLGNMIPEFNDLVYKGRWQEACEILHATNNFPEFTGRVCPAPCETACTLGVNDDPVMIRHIEYQIIEKGFANGWIKPIPAKVKTGKRVAVVGSGPAGLAAAQQLARAGHDVVVFEKEEKAGGLLRYGIPDFKMEKTVIDRRLSQMIDEGVVFQTGVNVGVDISARYLNKQFDCVLLTIGAWQPRDLDVPGRELDNVMFAMDFLTNQNKVVSAEITPEKAIDCSGKNVVVIGGGDTGSDCVGTSRRLGAKNIYQLEILPQPPESRPNDTPWPLWPRIMRTSSSHEEGCERMWSVMTKKLEGDAKGVKKLHAVEVDWTSENGKWNLVEKEGSEFTLDADMVLLAMGFVHAVHKGLVEDLGVDLDNRGNLVTNNYQTSVPWVFCAGDAATGASLVVRALDAGRCAAAAVDDYLKQHSN